MHSSKLSELNPQQFVLQNMIGKGTFGTVYKAQWITSSLKLGVQEQSEYKQQKIIVAVKKLLINPKYKNRQIQILGSIKHDKIIRTYGKFEQYDDNVKYIHENIGYQPKSMEKIQQEGQKLQNNNNKSAKSNKQHKLYTYIIMQYVPTTLSSLIREQKVKSKGFQLNRAICYLRQMLEGLQYMEQIGLCHRDIKPSNILVQLPDNYYENSTTFHNHKLYLCDFGSAKCLKPQQKSITYICSRYYRAPQLLLNCSQYSTKIDIWSIGCIFLQMFLCHAVFDGSNSLNQLAKILRIFGTPTLKQLQNMKIKQVNKVKKQIFEMQGIGLSEWIKKNIKYNIRKKSIRDSSYNQQNNKQQNQKQNIANIVYQISQKMLRYDPSRRFSAKQMITYLDDYLNKANNGDSNGNNSNGNNSNDNNDNNSNSNKQEQNNNNNNSTTPKIQHNPNTNYNHEIKQQVKHP